MVVAVSLGLLVGACATGGGGQTAESNGAKTGEMSKATMSTEKQVVALETAAKAAADKGARQRAARYWQKVVALDAAPEHAIAYARALRRNSDGERAYVALDENKPEEPTARYLRAMGKAAISAGYPERAHKALKQALRLEPENVMTRSVLAVVLARQGEVRKALDLAETAHAEAGERVFAPGMNLAMIQVQTGRIDQALATLEELAGRPGAPDRVKKTARIVGVVAGRDAQGAADRDNMPDPVRKALQTWIGRSMSMPDKKNPSEKKTTWYVRVTDPDAREVVATAARNGLISEKQSVPPIRVVQGLKDGIDGQRVVMLPVDGWSVARDLCERIKAAGATCQISSTRTMQSDRERSASGAVSR